MQYVNMQCNLRLQSFCNLSYFTVYCEIDKVILALVAIIKLVECTQARHINQYNIYTKGSSIPFVQ